MNPHKLPTPAATANFADRIRFLIQRFGGATEIARACGFSEGVVRSWRDGNTDPSRARCVTLARTLGISLVWLVAGEGSLQVDRKILTMDEQASSENGHARAKSVSHDATARRGISKVDSIRLSAAAQLLQSELTRSGSELSLSQNTDLLSELYEILGPDGARVDPAAMANFNDRLAERIRRDHQAA